MDGGYLEAEMMAKAGASYVVVMGRAHEATVRRVVDAAKKYDIGVMGDNLAAEDRIANAVWLESLGVDIVIHHIGYDERRLVKGLSPMDELDDVVEASRCRCRQWADCRFARPSRVPRTARPSSCSVRRSSSTPDDFKAASTDLHGILTEILRRDPEDTAQAAEELGLGARGAQGAQGCAGCVRCAGCVGA
jgi:3-hexulose-6-phosphate synthase/6-phospho-3-hexuloisomerase